MSDGGLRYFVNTIRVFTHDVTRSVEFYMDKVGLRMIRMEPGFVVFDVGGINWIVESVEENDEQGAALIGRFIGVSLSSHDILATFEILSDRGVQYLGAPAREEWGGYLAHFLDPDGNIISLVGNRNL